ncbi:MAG TPA: MucR family transcriptional regulator [Mycobacterium sp.]|nr:MucR family transcriptional regulator [Mycobacterium sp.]
MPDRPDLTEAYAAGATVAELAQQLDVTPKTVRARLARAGVSTRRRGRPVQIAGLQDRQWLRREYVVRGRAAATIAREIDCSETAVLDALRRHGLEVRDRGGGSRRVAMPGELGDDEWLRQRYSGDGASIRRIAADLEVSASAVATALRRAGVTRRSFGNQRAPLLPPPQPSRAAARRGGPRPVGVLADGTEYFASLGRLEFVDDGRRVVCHLCGTPLRLLSTSHLRRHGWSASEYREAFGLNRGTPLCAPEESARRRAIGLDRYRHNARVRDGLALGQERVRSGEALAMAHAAMPAGTARLQRRLRAAAVTTPQRERRRATATSRRLQRVRELGFRTERAYLRDRYVRRGWGIARIKAEIAVGSGVVERMLDDAGIPRRAANGHASRTVTAPRAST